MITTSQVKCYDNNVSYDRYTAVFPKIDGVWQYIAMNETPFHHCGFGQHGELRQPPGKHLGKRIKFEDLSSDCQKLIRQDLQELL